MSLNIPSGVQAHSATTAVSSSQVDDEESFGYNSVDSSFETSRVDSTNAADPTGRTFAYITAGAGAFMWAGFGRAAVNKFIATLSASADVMAMASLEVDVSNVDVGRATTVKWRGKPIFIRHRTEHEIELAKKDDEDHSMRDFAVDGDRVKRPEWIVLIGVCTHLGCVPINGAGQCSIHSSIAVRQHIKARYNVTLR